MGEGANRTSETASTSLTFADLEVARVPVYDGETVGEFCMRLTGVDGSSAELLWGTTYLPQSEIIQSLTITKPWQIDLRGGKERLQLRVPAGVAPVEELLKYVNVKPKPALGEDKSSKLASVNVQGARTKRKREDEKSNRSSEKSKKEIAEAAEAKKQKVEEEEVPPPAPVSTARNFSLDEYDKVQRKMNKSGKKTIKPVAPVPKAEAQAARFAGPKMNALKDVFMSNTASVSGKQPMRALTDIYGISSAANAELGGRVERNAQTVSRAEAQITNTTASPAVSEPKSPRIDDFDVAEQLTSLANAAIAASQMSPKKKSAQKKKPAEASNVGLSKNLTKIAKHLDERYKTGQKNETCTPPSRNRAVSRHEDLPNSAKPIIVHTGNILDAFKRMTRKGGKMVCDMSMIQTNTIGAYYYMTAAGVALQSVTLVPARYIDASLAAAIRVDGRGRGRAQ